MNYIENMKGGRMMKDPMQEIPEELAIQLANAEIHKLMTSEQIVRFQLFTDRLCMPFDVFHKAVEETLGRPVWTHEFGLNYDGLVKEFLGEAEAPTMEEILNLIPEEKRLIVLVKDN